MKVSPHTSLKHRMLGMYFLICRQIAKNRILNYVDLYAGDGEAECDESPLKQWKCPFIQSLLVHAKKGEIKLNCFLNELDPKNEGNYEKLKQNICGYEKFIAKTSKEDANIVCDKIINEIPASEWSIFLLDPCKYSDLNWATVEKISNHRGYDKISKCYRQPELIINLVTCTMQRAVKQDSIGISKALGTNEWQEKIRNNPEEKLHEIFHDIYMRKLESLGYTVNSFCIQQTRPNNNVLYYIIFASNIPNANEIITNKYKPYIDKNLNDKWTKENFKYRMITRAKKQGNTSLTDFQQKDS